MKKLLIALMCVLMFAGLSVVQAKEATDDGMMKKDEPAAMMKSGSPFGSLSALGPQVVAYNGEMEAQKLAKTQTVIYFFAASWCPSCKAVYKDITANYTMIPATATLVIVDYDTSGDLKKKYGVAMQHTFVTIDSTGMKKMVWNGSLTVKEILAKAGVML